MFQKRAPWVAALALVLFTGFAGAAEIHTAAEAGDAETVARLLRADPSLANAPDPTHQFAYRPLHFAAIAGHVEVARLLLEAGADIESPDSDESTPLHVAALTRQGEMVDFLIERGADVNRRDKNGAYALSFAASGGDSLIVRRILAEGADLNLVSEAGITLVHYAVSRNLSELLQKLSDRGDDMNRATAEGQTPLHWAARRGTPEIITMLLDGGAEVSAVDSNGMTPIIAAAFEANTEAIRIMLDRGADPNEANSWGGCPLWGAARHGDAELAKLLFDRGADPNSQLEDRDWLLHTAVNHGSADVVRAFMAANARTDVVDDNWGTTPLHVAARLGYLDVVEALLDGGASLNAEDHQGRTPLQMAGACGNRDVVDLLMKNGAGPSGIEVMRECPADFRDLGDREAVVWHLGHSGWAIKTENHFMVIDYSNRDREPAFPGLCNGFVNPDELADQNVTVFASHEHGDHYDPAIFEWRDRLDDVTYVLGCRPEDVPPFEFIDGREERTINGVKITTIASNDTGVGFLLEADGMVIYHAGDHANRQRDFSGPYKAEIDWLAAKGVRPDLAIMPISGCGFGDQEAVKMGVHYVLETLKPLVFLPMHAGSNTYRYKEFIEECKDRFPDTRMEAAEYRGDHFRYHKGKVS